MNTQNTQTVANELFDFIRSSPTAYQTTATLESILAENGFAKLEEGTSWNLVAGNKYYVTRNQSSLIAFVMPADLKKATGYQIIATHGDSPSFKLKAEFEQSAAKCAIIRHISTGFFRERSYCHETNFDIFLHRSYAAVCPLCLRAQRRKPRQSKHRTCEK
jgi:aspartyl aminopeptidase